MKITIVLVLSLFFLACTDSSEKPESSNADFKKIIKELEEENQNLKNALKEVEFESLLNVNMIEAKAYTPRSAKPGEKIEMEVMMIGYNTKTELEVSPEQGNVVEKEDGKAVVEFTTGSPGVMSLTGTITTIGSNGLSHTERYFTSINVLEEAPATPPRITLKRDTRYPRKDFANVYWISEYTLFDKATDEPIHPEIKDGKKIYKIYYSSNENPVPSYGEFTVDQLEKLRRYKFKNKKNCLIFCDKKNNE